MDGQQCTEAGKELVPLLPCTGDPATVLSTETVKNYTQNHMQSNINVFACKLVNYFLKSPTALHLLNTAAILMPRKL